MGAQVGLDSIDLKCACAVFSQLFWNLLERFWFPSSDRSAPFLPNLMDPQLFTAWAMMARDANRCGRFMNVLFFLFLIETRRPPSHDESFYTNNCKNIPCILDHFAAFFYRMIIIRSCLFFSFFGRPFYIELVRLKSVPARRRNVSKRGMLPFGDS